MYSMKFHNYIVDKPLASEFLEALPCMYEYEDTCKLGSPRSVLYDFYFIHFLSLLPFGIVS